MKTIYKSTLFALFILLSAPSNAMEQIEVNYADDNQLTQWELLAIRPQSNDPLRRPVDPQAIREFQEEYGKNTMESAALNNDDSQWEQLPIHHILRRTVDPRTILYFQQYYRAKKAVNSAN